MKKLYSQPEWKVMILNTEDAITTSGGDGTYGFEDGEGIMTKEADKWVW